MRIHKLVCAFFAIAFFASCSNDDEKQPSTFGKAETQLTETETKILLSMRSDNNRVSIDEVMEQVNWVIDFLNGENALKSGVSRKVNFISALVSGNAKAVALKSSGFSDVEIPDTLAYVLNFADSLGFAIVSADTRIDDPLLAFTGSGSLADSIDNPGVAIFLERLEDYMLNSIAETEQQKDSLLAGILEKLDAEIDETRTKAGEEDNAVIRTEIINLISPLVPVEWGQGTPFNNNLGGQCYSRIDDKYPAGCVAVAVAQIMARWGYPYSINGYSFNWTDLNKYTALSRRKAYPGAGDSSVLSAPDNVKNQLANLFQQIGKGVSMNYGCGGSSSNIDNAVNFLSKQGFKTGGIIDYNSSAIITSLNNKRPLIARGCSKKIDHKFLGITVSTSYDSCHVWVIDGYLKRRRFFGTRSSDVEHIHNNWGWSGMYDGYFAIGVFNSDLAHLDSNTGTKSSEPKNYQYQIKMAPNIYK